MGSSLTNQENKLANVIDCHEDDRTIEQRGLTNSTRHHNFCVPGNGQADRAILFQFKKRLSYLLSVPGISLIDKMLDNFV